MCMNALPECMSVYHVPVWSLQKKEDIGSPGTRVTDYYEISCEFWELKCDFLEQQWLLATETSLQASVDHFLNEYVSIKSPDQ